MNKPPLDKKHSEQVAGDSAKERASSDVLAATLTKQKLNQMMEDFVEFDQSMKIGTRQRREKDEQSIVELHDELSRLESNLNAEAKRRVEMNKALQAWVDAEIQSISTKFGNLLKEQGHQIDQRQDALKIRLQSLEEKFEFERKRIPEEIEKKNADLTKQLNDFQLAFEAERKSRLAREGEIMKRLIDHEQAVADTFNNERTERSTQYTTIRSTLDDSVRSRTKGNEAFTAFVKREIAEMKNQLTTECQTREREDDEIVEALNRYTAKLQDSLKIINSAET